MIVTDPMRPDTYTHKNRERLERRLKQHGRKLGFDKAAIQFPLLPVFKIDQGNPMRWEMPLIWGDSDLMAGKRKVNLLFTLLDHAFSILNDLGQNQSDFRPYLERAWQADTSGQVYPFVPGEVEDTFKSIANDLSLKKCKKQLVTLARARFPNDYMGVFLPGLYGIPGKPSSIFSKRGRRVLNEGVTHPCDTFIDIAITPKIAQGLNSDLDLAKL
jgi:hypothetical protein